MGAGTALGLYNVSLQYQQHNASHANCISSSLGSAQRGFKNAEFE